MAGVAKRAGVSRESLYRTLSASGNPELGTILKVMKALGLQMTIEKAPAASERPREKKRAPTKSAA
jgi:DNA-binding phage protein